MKKRLLSCIKLAYAHSKCTSLRQHSWQKQHSNKNVTQSEWLLKEAEEPKWAKDDVQKADWTEWRVDQLSQPCFMRNCSSCLTRSAEREAVRDIYESKSKTDDMCCAIFSCWHIWVCSGSRFLDNAENSVNTCSVEHKKGKVERETKKNVVV